MCWMCTHPGATLQDYLDHVSSLIAQHGWAVQAVRRDRLRPPFAYTVGLTAMNKPELVVTGMSATRAAALLNDVAAHMLHAEIPEPGERVPLIGGTLIEFVEVQTPTAHLLRAGDLYGNGIRALQVVHADDRGRWPWESGYRGVKGGQPVLGPRAPDQDLMSNP
jgi:Domain of unknown function (DUF4262)